MLYLYMSESKYQMLYLYMSESKYQMLYLPVWIEISNVVHVFTCLNLGIKCCIYLSESK